MHRLNSRFGIALWLILIAVIVAWVVLSAGPAGPNVTVAEGAAAAAKPSPKPTHTPGPTATATPIVLATNTPTPGPTPTSGPTPTPIASSGGDPVIVSAGDIACDPTNSSFNGGNGTSSSCEMLATAKLIQSISPVAVLPLGDTQYYCGGLAAFQQSYALNWGIFLGITHPTVGNHEYLTSGGTDCDATGMATGYYTYFGAAAGNPSQGYYSYNVGTWHLIALNTQCSSAGGCGTGSPQETWLQQDLAANPTACTLAYYHIPLWSSGGRANSNSQVFMNDLYNAHADLVLTGHDHDYERFLPQNPQGQLDTTNGIVEVVAGTGGANHTSFVTTAPNRAAGNDTTFGVLKLTLHASSYDFQFVPIAGSTYTDSGTQACH